MDLIKWPVSVSDAEATSGSVSVSVCSHFKSDLAVHSLLLGAEAVWQL